MAMAIYMLNTILIAMPIPIKIIVLIFILSTIHYSLFKGLCQ